MLLILSLACIFILGYLAQTTGLCMVRGVKEVIAGKPVFLISILLSGSFIWLATIVAELLGQPVENNTQWPTWFSFFGGFIFGLGAAFNGGCGVSTISRFARGQVIMIATMLGWLVSWLLFSDLLAASAGKEYVLPPFVHLFILISLSVWLFLIALKSETNIRKLWLSMFAIGVMAGLVFIYEPHWTPSGLLKSIGLSIWNGHSDLWPRSERFYLALFLVLGMAVAAVVTNSFLFEQASQLKLLKHFLAGILMGVGAVMAGGGNDSQLLIALPALSAAGAAVVLSIVLGIYFGLRIMSRPTRQHPQP